MNGVSGRSAQYHVEEQTKAELVFVTILLPNMAEMIVRLMDRLIQIPKDVTKIRVQVSQTPNQHKQKIKISVGYIYMIMST